MSIEDTGYSIIIDRGDGDIEEIFYDQMEQSLSRSRPTLSEVGVGEEFERMYLFDPETGVLKINRDRIRDIPPELESRLVDAPEEGIEIALDLGVERQTFKGLKSIEYMSDDEKIEHDYMHPIETQLRPMQRELSIGTIISTVGEVVTAGTAVLAGLEALDVINIYDGISNVGYGLISGGSAVATGAFDWLRRKSVAGYESVTRKIAERQEYESQQTGVETDNA